MKKWIYWGIVFLFACRGPEGPQGPQGPQGPEGPPGPQIIYVLGYVFSNGWSGVEVSFSPVIPIVKINGHTLSLHGCEGSSFFYSDSLPVTHEDSINLNVDYTKDKATASAVIPGKFAITSHDTSQTAYIPLYSNFTVTWSSSVQRSGYWISFWIWYEYETAGGEIKWYEFESDTFITSQSITFPASKLFPPDVDTVLYSWGYFDVYALSEPKLQPGAEGNVKGGGAGFFWGITFGGELYVAIEGTKVKVEKEKITREKLMEKLFEKVKKLDLNYQTLKESF